jgi:oligopeptidase B
MRDPFQLDPAIRAYLKTENDYCERALADAKSLQETLFAEMKGRIKEDDSSAPDPDGPYAYYVRYRKEGQHPLPGATQFHALPFHASGGCEARGVAPA